MRVPFKTETDAFRVAVALGLLAGASVLVGLLASRAYGVVVFAAGIAAGITFELAGRETGRGSALQRRGRRSPSPWCQRRDAPRPRGDKRRSSPVRSFAGSWRRPAEPVSSSTCSRRFWPHGLITWASDLDREREEAHERLEASLAWAAEQGFAAKGEVGDPDPLVAIEDELRDFGADEVIIVTHSRERTSWLANRMLGHLARELDVPVREIALGDDPDRSALPPPSPAE